MGWIKFDFNDEVKLLLSQVKDIIISDPNSDEVIFGLAKLGRIMFNSFMLIEKLSLAKEKEEDYIGT